jgi:hypothetical protein
MIYYIAELNQETFQIDESNTPYYYQLPHVPRFEQTKENEIKNKNWYSHHVEDIR